MLLVYIFFRAQSGPAILAHPLQFPQRYNIGVGGFFIQLQVETVLQLSLATGCKPRWHRAKSCNRTSDLIGPIWPLANQVVVAGLGTAFYWLSTWTGQSESPPPPDPKIIAIAVAIAVASLHGRLIDRPDDSRPDHWICIQNQCATNAGDGSIRTIDRGDWCASPEGRLVIMWKMESFFSAKARQRPPF